MTRRQPKPPTPRERDVLRIMRSYLRHFKQAPARLEIATAEQCRPTAELHLQRLHDKGHLRLVKRWRSIELLA